MAQAETFKFVGVSLYKGDYAVRYANDKGRAKVLERNGHTNVRFIELSQPERTIDAVDALLREDFIVEDLDCAQAVAAEGMRLGFVM
jgi:hypothetical protein